MPRQNGSQEPDYVKDSSLYQLEEVDLTRIPNSILAGLIPASGEDAVLRSEELYPENANEVWIIQCPTNIRLAPLIQGKKLFLDDRAQLFSSEETGDKTYEAICLPRQNSDMQGEVALLPDESGKMQLVSFPVSGHILIKELMEELPRTVPTPRPKKVHQLPSGVKVRHPIYGTDYDRIIQDLPLQLPPKKSRKKGKVSAESVYRGPEPTPLLPPSPEKQKRKKARTEVDTYEPEVIEEEHVQRKKKKRNLEPEHEIVVEMEVWGNSGKEKRVKSEREPEEPSSRNKRKRKLEIEQIEEETETARKKTKSKVVETFIQPESPPKKKRKKMYDFN